jgi:dTDP-4-amino-4,6-dideoxygalactose transaminase
MTQTYRIPFNRPTSTAQDLPYIREALSNGHLSGDGPFTRRCHRLIEDVTGVAKALLTTSCTHALEMSAFLLDIKPGDEVIVPSFTFVSTANAFVIRGARPVFADVRADTLCVDEEHVERLVTSQTRAVVAVHYAGIACQMDALCGLSARTGVPIVEDNAHGLFGRYNGRNLGTFGSMSTLSFHDTKNVTCGEGGALLINDPALVERAEMVREKGTNRTNFLRGKVAKYGWVDVGSSYLPSELLAAMLCAQLEDRQRIQDRRRELWSRYECGLRDWARILGITLPTIPASCEQSYHMFYMLMPSSDVRDRLAAHLKAKSILAVPHYLPLNVSKVGRSFGGRAGECPVSERVADTLIRLPFYTGMTEEEQKLVVETLYEFR